MTEPPKVDESTAKVWKLSAMDMGDDDIDLVDDDDLLDEDDLKKPDPASLRGIVLYVDCIKQKSVFNPLLNKTCLVLANSVDPDQLASEEANSEAN